MKKPPTLEYKTPASSATECRNYTADLFVTVGIANWLWGLACVAIIVGVFLNFGGPIKFRLGFVFPVGYVGTCFSCGTLYLIGGEIIGRPHKSWEMALLICVVIHAAFVVVMMGLCLFIGAGASAGELWIVGLLIFGAQLFYLAILFRKLLQLRRES